MRNCNTRGKRYRIQSKLKRWFEKPRKLTISTLVNMQNNSHIPDVVHEFVRRKLD